VQLRCSCSVRQRRWCAYIPGLNAGAFRAHQVRHETGSSCPDVLRLRSPPIDLASRTWRLSCRAGASFEKRGLVLAPTCQPKHLGWLASTGGPALRGSLIGGSCPREWSRRRPHCGGQRRSSDSGRLRVERRVCGLLWGCRPYGRIAIGCRRTGRRHGSYLLEGRQTKRSDPALACHSCRPGTVR
jgi:hypothetical protein